VEITCRRRPERLFGPGNRNCLPDAIGVSGLSLPIKSDPGSVTVPVPRQEPLSGFYKELFMSSVATP